MYFLTLINTKFDVPTPQLRKHPGVFEVEVFLLTCDSMRCSKEF
jgi:hypothetical protein